jgi:hypothetical protein
LSGLNRQREEQVVEGVVALANGRPRAGVTRWGVGDVSLVASASGEIRGGERQSRLMAWGARLRAIMAPARVRALGVRVWVERGGRWPVG